MTFVGVFGTMLAMRLTFLLLKIAFGLLVAVFLFDGAIWVTTGLMGVLMLGLFVFAIESVLTLCGAARFLAACHKDGLR